MMKKYSVVFAFVLVVAVVGVSLPFAMSGPKYDLSLAGRLERAEGHMTILGVLTSGACGYELSVHGKELATEMSEYRRTVTELLGKRGVSTEGSLIHYATLRGYGLNLEDYSVRGEYGMLGPGRCSENQVALVNVLCNIGSNNRDLTCILRDVALGEFPIT